MPGRAFQILLVEDDEIEAEAIRRSFRKYHLPNSITVAADGLAALELLTGTAAGGAPHRPPPLFLVLHMAPPGGSGVPDGPPQPDPP